MLRVVEPTMYLKEILCCGWYNPLLGVVVVITLVLHLRVSTSILGTNTLCACFATKLIFLKYLFLL